jgi:hypothetical protein
MQMLIWFIRVVTSIIWGLSGVVNHIHVFERDFSPSDPRLSRSIPNQKHR